MVTLTNAYAGYIPGDASYAKYAFEVPGSGVKPGYAEEGIVNGILDMMTSTGL